MKLLVLFFAFIQVMGVLAAPLKEQQFGNGCSNGLQNIRGSCVPVQSYLSSQAVPFAATMPSPEAFTRPRIDGDDNPPLYPVTESGGGPLHNFNYIQRKFSQSRKN